MDFAIPSAESVKIKEREKMPVEIDPGQELKKTKILKNCKI